MTNALESHAVAWMNVALAQAEAALEAGDAPVGAAIFDDEGRQVAVGRNREASSGDRFLHAEIDAMRALGARQNGSDLTLVTTVGPCWSCAGTIRFFGIPRLIVGHGGDHVHGASWLADAGASVLVLDVPRAADLILPWQEQHFPHYDMLRPLHPGI
jgi:creatinine deaminase